MEDLAVELAVEAVKLAMRGLIQHVEKNKQVIADASVLVENLEEDKRFLEEYLKEAAVKNNPKRNNLLYLTLVREVQDRVYKAGEAIDSFTFQVAESKSKWYPEALSRSNVKVAEHVKSVAESVNKIRQKVEEHLKRTEEAFPDYESLSRSNVKVVELVKSVAESVNKIRQKVEEHLKRTEEAFPDYESLSRSNVKVAELVKSVAESINKICQKVEEHLKRTEEAFPDYEGEPPIQEFSCIFKEEEERLKAVLSREAKQPDVIFITGTHGVGKTGLAAKMFLDSEVKSQFNKRIWVGGVLNPTPKNMLLVVLRQLSEDTAPKVILYELCKQVEKFLEGEKFLLVLDDVPEMSKNDFRMLCSAFRESDKRSKILITSNNDKLAAFVGDDSHIKLEPLEFDRSWALLKWRLFSGDRCPSELEIHGKLIAGNCNGLPHKIVSAGNALAEKLRRVKGPSEKIKVWEHFARGTIPFTLSSYNTLPYHLRDCFLYLGIFPRHAKFSVSKLTQMWIAEGFIPPRERVTLEETALEYLTELIERNLVKIEEKRFDGKAKTCSIDEFIYYKLSKENFAAEGESFLQEFTNSVSEGLCAIDEVKKNRRVCVHGHISKFVSDLISSSHDIGLHSFISHSNNEITLHKEDISAICKNFKMLRVLDAKPIRVNKIYSDLCLLVHLRYVTLSLNGDVLPASISNLRNVQTFIVYTGPSTTLEIKADILTMVELRHFKTNASANLPKKSKASKHVRLQTLCGISPKSCRQDFFSKIPNLKTLGICGRLALLLDRKEFLSELVKVEKLKLLNQVTGRKSEGNLSRLLDQSLLFLPNLRSLTLSATSIKWEHISNPGWMQKLEELKLKDNAFVGKKWKVSGDGFPNLQTLHIEHVDFIQWEASSNQFPQLRCLKLSKCKELREIPFALAEIRTFQELHLHNCSASAVKSARIIHEKKLHKRRTDSTIVFRILSNDF